MTLRIATRGSALARAQTGWVAEQLRALDPTLSVEVTFLTTQGDRQADRPLTEMGGKGVFVTDIQRALLAGEADAAVHSLKDMTADEPPELCVVAVPVREDPRDALILPVGRGKWGNEETGKSPESGQSSPISSSPHFPISLPQGARVGNSSLRRKAQLLAARPDLVVEPIRGNIDTRLRKLDEGQFDAIVLAAAGLRRLGLADRISLTFAPEEFVPAPGQGALAIEARRDSPWVELLRRLEDADARACVDAEQAVMVRLGGGCLAPVGAYAVTEGGVLRLTGMVALPDGSRRVVESTSGSLADAGRLAEEVAQRVLDAGGAAIVAEIRKAA